VFPNVCPKWKKTFTTLKPVPFESLDNTTTNSDQTQELIHYFLGTPDTYSTPPNHVTSTNAIPSILCHLNTFVSQPKDIFISKLLELTHANTDDLDLIRMELLKLAKQLCDFPYPKSTLKRRLERRSKDGDCLSVKLARDCYCLKLASNRVYSSDLGDICETITRVERDLITLRGEYIHDSEYLNRHVTTLTDNNSKLNVQLSKQSDRILNMQNQINLIRDGKFQKQLESLESRFNNLEAKLCKYSNISTTITKLEKKSMGEISAIVKQTKETNVKNSNDLKNLKVNLNGVQS
jgi:hypothetical protein